MGDQRVELGFGDPGAAGLHLQLAAGDGVAPEAAQQVAVLVIEILIDEFGRGGGVRRACAQRDKDVLVAVAAVHGGLAHGGQGPVQHACAVVFVLRQRAGRHPVLRKGQGADVGLIPGALPGIAADRAGQRALRAGVPVGIGGVIAHEVTVAPGHGHHVLAVLQPGGLRLFEQLFLQGQRRQRGDGCGPFRCGGRGVKRADFGRGVVGFAKVLPGAVGTGAHMLPLDAHGGVLPVRAVGAGGRGQRFAADAVFIGQHPARTAGRAELGRDGGPGRDGGGQQQRRGGQQQDRQTAQGMGCARQDTVHKAGLLPAGVRRLTIFDTI